MGDTSKPHRDDSSGPKVLATVLDREVTRKEFIGVIGTGILAVTGIDRLLQIINHHNHSFAKHGYGSGPYGGKNKVG